MRDNWLEKLHSGRSVVLGVGISNMPLIRFLKEHGCFVEARDRKTAEALGETAAELAGMGVPAVFGENYLEGIRGDFIFRSPGLRPDLEPIREALREGGTLLSEMELFFELVPPGVRIFAITGSDGKTTSTTLTAKLLQASAKDGARVWLGGNIGTPLLPYAEQMKAGDFVVLELSSFQLMTMRRSPDRAAVTNITPNHLNWHTGMEEYIAAKKNIFSHSVVSDVVLNAKNAVTAGFAKELDPGRVILFSAYTHSYEETSQACPGARCIYERDGSILWDDGKNAPKTLLRTDGILLPGRHNIENYMTALGLANGFVTEKAAREVAGTFPGVEHRLEFVRTCKGVRYYNSSIDSSPTRTAAALSALREKPIVICGGYDKQIPFEPLADALAARAKAVDLTGATAPKIMDAINRCGAWPAQVSVFTEPDFKKAVLMASGMAKSGDTVLLSPACASFDAFPNFEARGRYFKEIVSELPDTDLEHTTSTTHRLGSEEP